MEKENYSANIIRNGLFLAPSRTYGEQYIEPFIRYKYNFSHADDASYDAKSKQGIKYEIKSCKVLESLNEQKATMTLIEQVAFQNNNLAINRLAGAEPIYTGKEINDSYSFAPAKNYIIFERSNLQQVAPDEIYRSPKKLVYKTINKNLKFVIDTSKSLTTNSANIVIPQIDGLSIYSVLALLNSKLFTFVHYKMFGGVNKVAKEHLMALPLPALSKKQDTKLTQLTIDAIATNNDEAVQEFINSEIYHFNTKEINYIYDFVDNVINKKNRSRISKTTC